MTMDYHSKNVCLIGIIHIVDCLIEVIMLLSPCNHNNCLKKLTEEMPLVAYYVLLAALACLMIAGVVERRYKLLLPFLVLTSLALAQVALPVLGNISQGNFDFYQSIDRIGLGIMTVYPTYTLFEELRSQPCKKSPSVLTNEENEKKIIVV